MKFRVRYLATTPGHHDYPSEASAIVEANSKEEAVRKLSEREEYRIAIISVEKIDED